MRDKTKKRFSVRNISTDEDSQCEGWNSDRGNDGEYDNVSEGVISEERSGIFLQVRGVIYS